MSHSTSRRAFLAGATGLLLGAAPRPRRALVAITLDLEMSRNFPDWGQTHWDYEKGNLDEATKRYALAAGRRVKAAGGVVHYFVVGRVFEQRDVGWLRELAQAGHPVGNHTYDHVNVLATRPEDVQFRFNRAPWLIEGQRPAEVIRSNIRLTRAALKARVGVDEAGFRTPGGFATGLADRADVRGMLRGLGYAWVSSKYPAHKVEAGKPPSREVLADVVRAQADAQPFAYPDGLVEVPMSPVSDINAFRTGRWPLAGFLEATRVGVEHAIATGGCFDFLAHPSCLGVVDPEFRALDLIVDLVPRAGARAALVGLDALAERARDRSG